MPDLKLSIVTLFFAQGACAALICALMLALRGQFRRAYLQHWAWGWAALAIHHITAGLGIHLRDVAHLPASNPGRVVFALLSGASGYLFIGWILFGCYELIRRRPVRLRESRWLLMGLAATGFLTAVVFIPGPVYSPLRNFVRFGLWALVSSVAFGIASVAMWRARGHREHLGFVMASVGFFLYAAEQAHLFGVIALQVATGKQVHYSSLLGLADILLQTVIGVAMVACLLEDEREASELATVEIEHLAYHDAMTGLPNRPLFIDRLIVALAQASRAGHKLAVYFLDLDRFKDINDSLGHSIGDSLIKSAAERIRHSVREGDTVARFGGDEFTLLIPRIDNIEDAAKIAQKIIETLRIPFAIGDRELFVTTSIGVSIFPTDGSDPETLVRNADTAMYRAKEQGRDNYQLYAPAMNAKAVERLALENMLRKALTQGELVLHYQPIVDIRAKHVVGIEALMRWQHPERGLLGPGHFISVAELSGLIVPMGTWAMHEAARQTRVWQKHFGYELRVSVNLSARQFQQPDLIEQVRRVLEDTDLPATSLDLEITESSAMHNVDNTIYLLGEIKALGVHISMDDFGTGYSSLNYLKRFPIDTLKLDQAFVRELSTNKVDAAIASAVITLAHSLNLKVVAEGVETEEQLEFLRSQGCDYIQGYYFSRPLPVPELEAYLMQHQPSESLIAASGRET
jgi:diguanylate cyclase (GGDEF)-like protein